MADAPTLTADQLRTALSLWALSVYSTADIAEILKTSEAAVANSIGRFHGFIEGRAA